LKRNDDCPRAEADPRWRTAPMSDSTNAATPMAELVVAEASGDTTQLWYALRVYECPRCFARRLWPVPPLRRHKISSGGQVEARWIVNGKTEGRGRVLGSFIHHRERQSGS
jgi:hypothetical protein